LTDAHHLARSRSHQPRLRELEAVAARTRELEHELLGLYPQIAGCREALRALTEEFERRD
jgi:hypothetical protein